CWRDIVQRYDDKKLQDDEVLRTLNWGQRTRTCDETGLEPNSSSGLSAAASG
ncbi:unnamed protein product, partial [Brassica rapa]